MQTTKKKWAVIGLDNFIIVNAGPDQNWTTCGRVAHRFMFESLRDQELRDKGNTCGAFGRFALVVETETSWDIFGGFSSLAECDGFITKLKQDPSSCFPMEFEGWGPGN